MMGKVCHMIVNDMGDDNVFLGNNKKGKKIENNKKNMSTWRIYMLGSTRVHKCLHHPCMSEYGSESQTLCIYACVCICEACERCLLMELSVMKIVEVDFVVV